jgi:hypothetical protein
MSDSDDEMEAVEDEAARREAMQNLVPSLPQSQYGQMPASFYKNSQRVAPTTIGNDKIDNAPAPGTSQPPRSKPIRAPIIPRDRYDGVDSDDETDSENEAEEDDEEEDQPQVVGDVEVDMGEEEEEFLEFSRKALGISDAQWGDIVRDRRRRGGAHVFLFIKEGLVLTSMWWVWQLLYRLRPYQRKNQSSNPPRQKIRDCREKRHKVNHLLLVLVQIQTPIWIHLKP